MAGRCAVIGPRAAVYARDLALSFDVSRFGVGGTPRTVHGLTEAIREVGAGQFAAVSPSQHSAWFTPK